MNTREEFLNYLDNNHAFMDSARTSLTSSITRYLRKHLDVFKEMQVFTGCNSENPAEIIYRIVHPDFSNKCQICGKDTPFQKYYNGYSLTCSPKCAHLLTKQKGANTKLEKYGSAGFNNREKSKKTCLEKYGTESFVNVEKRKQTNLERYGVEYANNVEKGRQTCLDRYGVENVMQSKQFLDKQKSTNLKRRGVEYAMQAESTKQKYTENCRAKTGKDWYTQTEEVQDLKRENLRKELQAFKEKNNCLLRNDLIRDYGQSWLVLNLPYIKHKRFVFYKNEYLPKIQECYENAKNNISTGEKEIYDYCISLLPGTEVLSKCRDIIKSEKDNSAELDIYIPSKKVAIEFNGLYWHSLYDKKYHLHKTEECEKLGIRLIHIWEDYWISKKDICKSLIASALGIYERKIYARNCDCRIITSEECSSFLEKNHIQGDVKASLRLGLFYNNEPVQVACWGKSRFKEGEYELYRMCSLLNTQVVGGFSKLIKHSDLSQFISYVDRALFNGKGYESTGFKVIEYTTPGYFYHSTKPGEARINRVSAQKHKLSKMLEKYDPTLSEVDNMMNNGYFRIYDCGNIKVEYKKPLM